MSMKTYLDKIFKFCTISTTFYYIFQLKTNYFFVDLNSYFKAYLLDIETHFVYACPMTNDK